ncbi:MAG: hypothetical protein PSU93_09285 [Methylobacter sp.]|uniref:Uncharacterized protein n=1 Tax=Candidatus Methylobacter titanis TaxID=3053457 RepID=A0AA43Q8P3_9GAMM|nr:hypothetical protein [Candidatus Methylobacter titanis]
MSQTPPVAPDELPVAPHTNAPSVFAGRMDNLLAALAPFRAQLIALATTCYNNAVDAYDSSASAATQAANATISAASAATQAANAAISATSAAASPGTTGTSITSLTITTTSQTLTTQTGKTYVPGMFVVIADATNPAVNYMFGQVISYVTATGVLVVNVTAVVGSGTLTNWSISTSSPQYIGVSRGRAFFSSGV